MIIFIMTILAVSFFSSVQFDIPKEVHCLSSHSGILPYLLQLNDSRISSGSTHNQIPLIYHTLNICLDGRKSILSQYTFSSVQADIQYY